MQLSWRAIQLIIPKYNLFLFISQMLPSVVSSTFHTHNLYIFFCILWSTEHLFLLNHVSFATLWHALLLSCNLTGTTFHFESYYLTVQRA